MTELIEHTNDEINSDIKIIKVGDRGSQVSLKVYQDIYHQVTGRTEQITKRYSENLLLDMSQLEQLHYKIHQLCDVHNIVAKNETVTVFHEKERKEQFTSFSRFKTYNANTTSPCVSVVFKYNFSIILADLKRPQEYAIAIRLTSRIAILKQIQEDSPSFMRGRFLSYIGANTAEVTIDYTDYVIARGFLEAIDEWIVGSKKTPVRPWLKHLTNWSHLIPTIGKLLSAALITWFALQAIPHFSSPPFEVEIWAKLLVIFFGGGFIIINLMTSAGRLLEDAIDSYPTLSYLNLNRGDEQLIKKFDEQTRGVIWKFLWASILAIVLGILSAKLDRLIT